MIHKVSVSLRKIIIIKYWNPLKFIAKLYFEKLQNLLKNLFKVDENRSKLNLINSVKF